jgi:subtilisin family serine protease
MKITPNPNGCRIKSAARIGGSVKKIFFKLFIILILFSTQSNVFSHPQVASAKASITKSNHTAKNTKSNRIHKKVKLEKRIIKNKSRIIYRRFVDQSISFIGANFVHQSGYTGKGTYVVLLDTGIDKTHPMFNNKVVLEACFTASNSCPNGKDKQIGSGAAAAVDWHGSHVSGIMAGSYQQHIGVAPDANIIAINVFDKDLSSTDSSIIAALKWVDSISSKYNIASLNMSLGTNARYPGKCDYLSPSMTTAVKNLYNKNIAVVAAAGNSYSLGMSSPACISYAVSVAAVDNTNSLTQFSNISKTTTFAAPGLRIVSAGANGIMRAASGTSMAAPHVAGVFALYRQIYPNDTLAKTITRLKYSSTIVKDYYSDLKVSSINVSTLLQVPDDPSVTTSTTSTTLPEPVVVTTTVPATTTTTIPLSPFKPYLLSLHTANAQSKYFYVVYSDATVDKSLVKEYDLDCDGRIRYVIPVEHGSNSHTYYVDGYPNFTSCILYAVLKDGLITSSTPPVFLSRG